MVLTELEKKERNREASRKSYHKNKEKNKERKRESSHKYYHENKEKNKEKNKERKREANIKYYNKNKEKLAQRHKAYNQTEQGKKSIRIRHWRSYGVICENFDNLYDYFINCKDCENCGVELTVDKQNTATTRCLDHCHETGEFRDVLCNRCNVKRK